jgi:hypothetical protein
MMLRCNYIMTLILLKNRDTPKRTTNYAHNLTQTKKILAVFHKSDRWNVNIANFVTYSVDPTRAKIVKCRKIVNRQ